MPRSTRARVLVVDDNLEMARLLSDQLSEAGYAPEIATGGEAAIAAARREPFDAVITDLRMEKVDGLDVLRAVHAIDPSVPVLIMTAFGGIDSAIEAIKHGAYHYFTKPFRLEEVLLYVQRALADRRLRDEHRSLQRLAEERSQLAGMVGQSQPMRQLYELVERVAASQAPVLIRGESGSGKELVARAIHFQGPRREQPFVAVNCTALPATLLESELFGHVKGAFTGSTQSRRGLFVEADGGTLFLDEIGDMASELQARLLRVLEDGEVRAVGADASRKVDVRIVAATHQDLERRVREGAFRADLLYRLNVVPIAVPPLRERREDIPRLIEHFLGKARQKNPHSRVERFSPEAVAALSQLPWPGNVRELENVVERLVIMSAHPTIELAELESLAPSVGEPPPIERARQRPVPLRQLEDDYITWVVSYCGGNKTKAAELLGIDVSTIHRRMRGGAQ